MLCTLRGAIARSRASELDLSIAALEGAEFEGSSVFA